MAGTYSFHRESPNEQPGFYFGSCTRKPEGNYVKIEIAGGQATFHSFTSQQIEAIGYGLLDASTKIKALEDKEDADKVAAETISNHHQIVS